MSYDGKIKKYFETVSMQETQKIKIYFLFMMLVKRK